MQLCKSKADRMNLIYAQHVAALRHLCDRLELEEDGSDPPSKIPKVNVTNLSNTPVVQQFKVITGNNMVDQFQPWYFGVAFAFLFKYCTGMPDMPSYLEKQRYRRPEQAPRIEMSLWARVMARRAEAQISRDWHFGFVSWNYWFRSTVNLSRTLYSYEPIRTEEGKQLEPGDLQRGAIEIMKALFGKFQDATGRLQAVAGDMTKVRYVPGLSAAAKRLLLNIQHTSRKVPGTQEIRRLMRFETHAFRVAYGVPIFVTFTPDEGHNMLMLRFSRVRQNDPLFSCGNDMAACDVAGLWKPKLSSATSCNDDVTIGLPIEDILTALPPYDVRRTILARDPLASTDGFRTLIEVSKTRKSVLYKQGTHTVNEWFERGTKFTGYAKFNISCSLGLKRYPYVLWDSQGKLNMNAFCDRSRSLDIVRASQVRTPP